MRYTVTRQGENLASALLKQHGLAVEQPCGGRGKCGRCRVKILDGQWQCQNERVSGTGFVLACQCRLLSEQGSVEVPDSLVEQSVRLEQFKSTPFGGEPGLALDLGSTTVVGRLYSPDGTVYQATILNRQSMYGGDVMSRITYVAEHKDGLGQLRQAALESIGSVMNALTQDAVPRMVIAGNTVMMCLLHGISPESIGAYPYIAPQLDFPDICGADMGLEKVGIVSSVPCASGFIGGDVICGLLAYPLSEGEALVDIGTNCEMVLNAGGHLLAVSAAAGPAFEGRAGGFTVRAVNGAIDHVLDDGSFTVIGGRQNSPAGLCGSGVIDYLAVRRRQGLLQGNGQFSDGRKVDFLGGLEISAAGISDIQLAKAAVYSGVKILEQLGGCRCRRMYLAGTFGEKINWRNACAIGMLPQCEILPCGNTSLQGALVLARHPERMGQAAALARSVQSYPLSEQNGYQQIFVEGLLL